MSKAILIIDMPDHCYECPLENSKRCPFLWEDVESLDKPKDCPLKPYEEAIPIEWIEKQILLTTDITNKEELDVLYAGNLSYMLKLWKGKNK